MERKLGEITGKAGGTLFIAIGQIHGNEPAGTFALQKVFEILEAHRHRHPEFVINGKIVGIIGNLPASKSRVRFADEDLNRMWTPDRVAQLRTPNYEAQSQEEKELIALEQAIIDEIKAYRPSDIFILDIHTTTAQGGTFSIPINKASSHRVAEALQTPVIQGLADTLPGTLITYAAKNPWEVETSALVFEAGQHDSLLSVSQAVSAVFNALLELELIAEHPLQSENKKNGQNSQPTRYSKIVYRHRIQQGDQFVMKPGYENFMPIRRGELLAHDKNGPIYSHYTGYILMPLYQNKGEDGFFVVVEE